MNEVFIYPLFNHCLCLKSYWKCLLGVVLYFGRCLLLIILLTYTRQNLSTMHSSNNTSTTPPSMFYSHHGPLSDTQDGQWMLLLEFLSVASVLTFFISVIEFYYTQVPYKMKGLVIGIFHLLRNIFVVSQALSLPFKLRHYHG